jgi:hypothetical protein
LETGGETAIDGHDVGELAGFDGADAVGHARSAAPLIVAV